MFNQKGGSKTDTLIKLVLIFFISLLSFSVGTYVGKQFSDSQHKLAALDNNGAAEEGDRETASIDPEAAKVAPEDALTDADVASLSDEFTNEKAGDKKEHAATDKHTAVAADKHEEAPAKQEVAAHHVAPAPAKAAPAKPEATKHEEAATKHEVKKSAAVKKDTHKADAVTAAAEKVAHGEEPAQKEEHVKEEKRIPASLPNAVAASSVGKFTVQVASYSTESDAQGYTNKLKDQGFSAFYVSASVNGTTWYRVSVGLFTNKDEAMKYRKELMSKASVSSAIVQKIVK